MVNLKEVLVAIVLVLLVGMIGAPGLAAESEATKAEYQSIFKSPQGEAAYMAAYDGALEKWPVPYETKYVPTAYGDTHMIISGPEDGEPLMLIHGGDSDATIWSHIIADLARSYRVYALDVIGYAGKSKAVKGMTSRGDLAEWLTDVLDALGIEKTYMAGWSMGGYLTTNYALERPERLKKIVLIAPAATFLPFSKSWYFKVILPNVVAALATDVHGLRRFASFVIPAMHQGFGVSEEELAEGAKDKDLAELMSDFGEESLEEYGKRIDSLARTIITHMFAPSNLAAEKETVDQWVQGLVLLMRTQKFTSLRPYQLPPLPLPDEDLKKLKTPTLLIYADQEVMYDIDPAFKRAEELVENIQTVLIPNASHLLVYEQPEKVSSHMLDFLSGDK